MSEIEFLKRNLFIYAFAGLILGVFLRNFFEIKNAFAEIIILISSGLLIFVFSKIFLRKELSRARVLFLLISTSVFFVGVAIARYNSSLPSVVSILESSLGQEVSVEGTVSNFPETRPQSLKVVIKVGQEKILAYPPRYSNLKYGQKVTLRGKLGLPEKFETDSGLLFDYPKLLAKDHIRYVLNFAKVENMGDFAGNNIVATLYAVKEKSLEKIDRSIVEPKSALLSGILLGEKSSNEKLEETFRKVSLSHIIVLSGYNMAIVASGILYLLRRAPNKFKYTVASISIILFTVMVASGAATVRAAVMALIAIFAKNIGRKVSVWRVLFLAVFVMILQNPLIVFGDVGFQLSFLATAGIVAFSTNLEKNLSFLPKTGEIREIASVSLAAQAAVLPLIIYLSGALSVFAIPVNLIVLPVVPVAMFFGLLLVCVSFISGTLAFPVAFFNDIILSFIIKIADFFARLPFSSIEIATIPPSVIFVLYLIAFGAVIYFETKKSRDNLQLLFKEVSISQSAASSQNLPRQSAS